MIKRTAKLMALFSLSASLFAAGQQSHEKPPHILPDVDGKYYQNLLAQSQLKISESDNLGLVVKMGERNLQWLDYINKFREQKLSFSTPENTKAYPIYSPKIYNENLILERYENLLADLPTEMKEVLIDGLEFTDVPPIDERKYLEYGFMVDGLYQSAARYRLVTPYKDYYIEQRAQDIRGYYHLDKLENREKKLAEYSSLSDEEQTYIRTWAIGMCYNSIIDESKCGKELDRVIRNNNGDISEYYKKYLGKSKRIYNDYFRIPDYARRKDIRWDNVDEQKIVYVPFKDNVTQDVKSFLHNIELEWNINHWKLLLEYSHKANIPYILFKPGVTPHVNGLGGNEIVMDANAPLTEWDVQWTIRHEYGHVLGFPDCYVEFYDESTETFVNYQIDIDNLMCSRRGKVFDYHFVELARNNRSS